MRKMTWIIPVVSLCLALLFSVGAVCAFSPVLVNVLLCDIENNPEDDWVNYTWEQSEAAHDLLLWQAKHAVSPAYRAACLQYLVYAYYHPYSDWSRTHVATGEAVHEAYLQALETYAQSVDRQTDMQSAQNSEFYTVEDTSTEIRWANYGFLSPKGNHTIYGIFNEPTLEHAAYVYLHIDKARGKEMYLTYAQNATDHYFCGEFLGAVLQDSNADSEDIAWAKAQANAAADALSTEYQVFVDLQADCWTLFDRLQAAGEVPTDNAEYQALYKQAFKTMPHTNTEYEAKYKALQDLASDTN
ncbi:MAG: hypothetical protein ACI4LI_08050 [Candidatus Fimenecus sp.]